MRTETKNWDALEYRTACALDGTPVRLSTYRRNGFTMAHIPEHLAAGENDGPDEAEIKELQDELCYDLNEVERRTFLRIMQDWTLHEIAKDEGVSHPAIYCRIRGKDGKSGMVLKNRFVWFWWHMRKDGRPS